MANIQAAQSAEMRAKGEAMIQQADKLLCESWNERMWSDGDTPCVRGPVRRDRPRPASQPPHLFEAYDRRHAFASLQRSHTPDLG